MQESIEGLVHIRSVEYGVNDIQNKALLECDKKDTFKKN